MTSEYNYYDFIITNGFCFAPLIPSQSSNEIDVKSFLLFTEIELEIPNQMFIENEIKFILAYKRMECAIDGQCRSSSSRPLLLLIRKKPQSENENASKEYSNK